MIRMLTTIGLLTIVFNAWFESFLPHVFIQVQGDKSMRFVQVCYRVSSGSPSRGCFVGAVIARMRRTLGTLLLILLFAGLSTASSPVIVVKRKDTVVGTFVIYAPASSGGFRATVYLESPNGIEQTCASMSWFDDNNNPQTCANVCSDSSAKGGFVLPIRAKGGASIYLNFNSGAGPIYTTLEKF